MRRTIIALILLAGCGGLDSREDDLNKSLLSYTEALRWQRWKQAAGHIVPEKQAQWLSDRMAASRNLNLADVTLQGVERGGDPRAEKVIVYMAITWYRLPDTTLRSSLWKQEWRHAKDGWRIAEETAVEAPPEPLAPEPAPAWP